MQLVFYLIIWLCLCGLPQTFFSFGIGIACIALTYATSPKCQYIFKLRFFYYVLWLAKEMILSSFYITKLVWSKKQPEPLCGWIETNGLKEERLILYANSITLTPGTFTMNVSSNKLFVHCITKEGFEALSKNSQMAKEILKIL